MFEDNTKTEGPLEERREGQQRARCGLETLRDKTRDDATKPEMREILCVWV